MAHVEEVHLADRQVILSDDRLCPITWLFNCRGETTFATCEAVSGVAEAGPHEFYAFEVFPRERAQ